MAKVLDKISVTAGRFHNEREIKDFQSPGTAVRLRQPEPLDREVHKAVPRSLESRTLDKILRFIPEVHDHIWKVHTERLGKAQFLNYMIDGLIRKYRARNTCLVSRRAIYKDMFALYSDIPFYHLNLRHDDYAPALSIETSPTSENSSHVHHCTMDESMDFLNNKRQLRDHEPAVKSYLAFTGISSFADTQPRFSGDVKQSSLRKVGNLDLGNFMFLASKARAIVGLRYGFVEVLAAVRERGPLYVLYTPFFRIDTSVFFEIFTLKSFPFCNETGTFEFAVPEGKDREVLDRILTRIHA